MEHRRLGKTGLMVSPLGFGGSEIGYEEVAQATVSQLLNEALDAGLNVIDTAECYRGSEELIGKAVAHRRREFYLFTKVGHMDGWSNPANWSKAGVLASLERSLRRLKTDHVDLAQLHSCDRETLQRGECIEGLVEAQKRGYTRFLGYSGDGEDALEALKSGRFDTLQTSVNLADQQALSLLLPVALELNVGVIAKRPVANAAWRDRERPVGEYHEPYWERLQALAYPQLQGKEAFATALRFTLGQVAVHTAIVGTTRPGRWVENAKVAALGRLPAAEEVQLRARWAEVAKADWVGQV